MADQRLPTVNSDDGAWGTILNQYISTGHYNGDSNFTQGSSFNGKHAWVDIVASDLSGSTQSGTASGAPLKFTSGPLLGTPQAGAVEFLTDRLYFTQTTGTTRKTVAAYDDSSGATGDLYYRDSSANFVKLPIGATGKVLNVESGLPAWGPATATAATASTIALRDSGGNLTVNNLTVNNSLEGYTTTATAAGTTTLTVSSTYMQYFTGSTTQTVVMPVASTLVLGQQWMIVNNSTGQDTAGQITVQTSAGAGNTILVLDSGSFVVLTCILTSGTTVASWSYSQTPLHITVSKTAPTQHVYGDVWIDIT